MRFDVLQEMKNPKFITLILVTLILHTTAIGDDLVAPSDDSDQSRFSAETERAFKQEAAADFVAWYSTDGKLDIGVGRTDKKENLHHPISFTLDELEGFFNDQKHKDLIVVGIEKQNWTDEVLQEHVNKLKDYFVARGYSRVVIQQAYGSGRGIHLEHTVKKEAEQAGTGQPATRSQSKSEGSDKPQPEAEGRSR